MRVRTSRARVVCTSGSASARVHAARNSTKIAYSRTENRIFAHKSFLVSVQVARVAAIAVRDLDHQVPRIFTGPSLRQPASDKR